MQLSLPVVLFIVFLVLKLTEVITWSWWWVTSPLWISAIISFIVLMITLTVANKTLTRINRRF